MPVGGGGWGGASGVGAAEPGGELGPVGPDWRAGIAGKPVDRERALGFPAPRGADIDPQETGNRLPTMETAGLGGDIGGWWPPWPSLAHVRVAGNAHQLAAGRVGADKGQRRDYVS